MSVLHEKKKKQWPEHMTNVHHGGMMQGSHLCQNTSWAPNIKVYHDSQVEIIFIVLCVNTILSYKHTRSAEVKLIYSNLWWIKWPKTNVHNVLSCGKNRRNGLFVTNINFSFFFLFFCKVIKSIFCWWNRVCSEMHEASWMCWLCFVTPMMACLGLCHKSVWQFK